MSVRIYRLLLRLYPREFRLRWEGEMLETFALQVAHGQLDAWRSVLPELLLATRHGLAIPVVSLAGSGVILFSLTWALGNSIVLLHLFHRLMVKLGG